MTAALEIGSRLGGGYALLVSTGAQRATQTLACFACALRDPIPGGAVVEPGLRSEREDRWREAYRKADGSIGFRCPAEPVSVYVSKGGRASDTTGRKCICNALMANVGLAQVRRGGQEELPLVTCGEEVRGIASFARSDEAQAYTARDVISHLLSSVKAPLPC